jgi:hypothetical protein
MTKRKKPAQRTETARPATNDTQGVSEQGATKLDAVERDAKGRIVKGALNGGGLTKEQREARDALNRWLCAAPQVAKGKAAYLAALDSGNPVIIKDWMERVAGKPKEHIELSGEVSATVEHEMKAEVVQSPVRQIGIVAVLERAGQLPQGSGVAVAALLRRAGQLEENTETAGPVETKPGGE